MTKAPVLALPDFFILFTIECEASSTSIGAVLLENNNPLHILALASKVKNLSLSTYEKELKALLVAIQK